MPEHSQTKKPTGELPRDLPMPKYDYQKPSASGSYTMRYDEKREEERRSAGEKVPAAVQNLCMGT
jgi:hypothetical protein